MQSGFAVVFGRVAPALLVLALVPVAQSAQTIHGQVPPAVRNLKAMGRLAADKRLPLAIGLPLRNEAELTNLLEELYNPASPKYRQWLSVEQFTARFGPTEADYEAVKAYAKGQGFTIAATHPNRRILDVQASVGQIERAFHVALRVYRHPKDGRTFFAPDAEPTLDLSVPISSIAGLDNFTLPRPAALVRKTIPKGPGSGPVPLGGSGPNGSYIGRDFRTAYVPNVSLAGSGQFVGLLQFDGYYPADISKYLAQAGMTNVPLINVLVDGTDGSPGPNNVEVALDIQMAISMAPGLSGVMVYEGIIGNDILNRMATDNLAKQLSASWTFPTDNTTPGIFQQFAAQGQSYFNASGDDGAYSGTPPSPCDSPYITAVGGTTLTTSSGHNWVGETAWNWAPSQPLATGGGISQKVSIPSWQRPIDMSTNLGSSVKRNVPDVALIADNVFSISDDGQSSYVGGTSVGSPLWAGFIALVNQQAAIAGQPSVGFINPAVYSIGLSTNFTAAFHDVKTGNNIIPPSSTGFYAVPGYDLCTGWGTPTGKNLINLLAPPTNAPVIVPVTAIVALETCTPTNGAVDPGEAVTVSFSLQNIGGLNTTNLMATLLETNNVTPTSGPQTYGTLVGLGPAVSRQFVLTASGECGTSIHPVLQLQDGSADLGLLSFSLLLGAPVGVYTQNFDSVTAPALPGSWSGAVTGGGSDWVTATAARDTVPNSAYAPESTNAGLTELTSPVIPVTTTSAQLTFRNSYNTEVDPADSTKAYDGGVLEIKIGAGAFTDVLAAGGSFVSGGYTRSIQTTENPLDGRSCWAGASAGFITTTLNLPASAAGQDVQFKFAFGTDIMNGYGGTGWYIDSVVLKDGFACCTPSLTADLSVSQVAYPATATVGQPEAFSLTVSSLGPGAVMAGTVTDLLPANSTLSWASPGYTSNADGSISWDLGFYTAGRTTNFTVLVIPGVEGPMTNTVTVAAELEDPNPTNNVAVTVLDALSGPSISEAPVSQTALPGTDVTFTVTAMGTEPLSYQWLYYGTNLPGQTESTLTLTNVQPLDAGPYAVKVSNSLATVTSPDAALHVLVQPAISLTSLGVTPGSISVSVETVPGLSYQLEYKDALDDAAWIPVEPPAIGTGLPLMLQDTNVAGTPERFYRVNCY